MDPSAPYSGYENVSFENNGGSYGVESAFTFSAGGAILDPASFIVNTAADVSDPNDGLTSLREAIAWANSTPGDDTITFNPSLAGQTIILTGGQLELTDTAGVTTITGLGADQLTIDGNQASRIFKIDSSVTADISGVTIANGKGGDDGGGIYNAGVLSIADSTISGNSAWHTGGGVYNSGTLNIADCTLAGNSSGDYGGGIYNDAGSMTSTAGTVTITDSTLSDNSASDNGGGIFNQGTLTITNSTLSGNSAEWGGGIYNNRHDDDHRQHPLRKLDQHYRLRLRRRHLQHFHVDGKRYHCRREFGHVRRWHLQLLERGDDHQ